MIAWKKKLDEQLSEDQLTTWLVVVSFWLKLSNLYSHLFQLFTQLFHLQFH